MLRLPRIPGAAWTGAVLALGLLLFGGAAAADGQPASDATRRIVVYVAEGCPHCAEAKTYLDELVSRRPSLDVVVRDVRREASALAELRRLGADRGLEAVSVPTFVIGDRVLVGFDAPGTTGRRIEATLDARASPPTTDPGPAPGCAPTSSSGESSAACGGDGTLEPPRDVVRLPIVGVVGVSEVGLPVFTAAIGLLDGFNPCAMWVLLFLLSILVNLRSRSRMLLVGGIFVLVSGLVYFAFMAAWLNAFVFLGVTREIQVALGIVALALGGLNLKDFVAFGRGPSLGIPKAAKPGIYARTRRILTAKRLAGALGAVVVLAFLVNTVELLCTAGLPALYTQILSLRGLSTAEHYGYLALYNVFYMLDDALVLTVAVVTLSHHRLQQKEARWLKLVSGGVMAGLGLVLLARPEVLTG